ncbi:MAG TPA: GerMN domain-containing protein, partial [Candidatus Saccharimonadales bacterium]|nr:GerMN domain-containing protein [Candidatus Saccharimonadales bacterium]
GEAAPPPPAAAEEAPGAGVTDAANQVEVTLYFLAADGEMLAPEKRRIFRTTTVTDRARQTVQALLDGPESPLQRALPPGTKLNEIFVARDGTAYVDLSSEFRHGIETGSSDGVSAIYSIVDTLAGNFDEIARVKILLDGQEVEDIGGHFDLSRPILPEMSQVDRH